MADRSFAPDVFHTPELAFGYELRETSRLLLEALKRRIAPCDITLAQYFLMRQLCDRLQTTAAASVQIIDSLEERGFIKRIRDDSDRRVTHVYLTAKGRTLRSKLLHFAYAVSKRALRNIAPASVVELRRVLALIRDNLEGELAEQVIARAVPF
jgi:DNA-binding MarR family transcriptional regulator